MKNSLIVIIILSCVFSLTSCSRNRKFGKGEIERAQKQFLSLEEKDPMRTLAANSDVCFSDAPSEAQLLEEIRNLEPSKVSPVKKIINGLDLSSFPPSQAQFIEKKSSLIDTSGVNVSECHDVKCLFGKLYESDGYEGLLHYYFYLKTNYALSSFPIAPGFNLSAFTAKNVLFSRNELLNFYYLSKSLGTPFQKMPTLATFYRMPKFTPFTESATRPKNACGLAGEEGGKGYILLTDDCLKGSLSPKLNGGFFSLVTHELSHRLDYNILPDKRRFSETKAWMELSGWYKKEGIDKDGNATWGYGRVVDPNLAPDDFVRDYTKTDPGEDFADSIGFARFTPEDVQKSSPRKYQWIVKNIFGNQSYAKSDLGNFYADFLTNYSMDKFPLIINNCVANNKTYSYDLTPAQQLEYRDYDPALIQCIFGGITTTASGGIRELKLTQLEACSYLANSEALIKQKVLDKLGKFLRADLNKNIEIAKQLQILADFISSLNEAIDAREIFVNCQGEKSSISCYNDEIARSFDEVAEAYSSIPNQLKSYRQSYLEDNQYIQVKNKMADLFFMIYSGSDTKLKEEAKKKWQSCYVDRGLDEEKYQGDLILTPFSGGSQFVKKSLLNCINSSSEEDLFAVIDKIGKKLGIEISNDFTKKFIMSLYVNNYISTLQSFVDVEASKEGQKIKEKRTLVSQKVAMDLTKSADWLGTTSRTDKELLDQCEEQAKKVIRNSPEFALNDNELNFYSAESDVGNTETCRSVASNNKIKAANEINKVNLIKTLLEDLNPFVLKEAASSGSSCKNKFSSNNTLVVKSRNLCLTNSVIWKGITDRAIDGWIATKNISYISSAKTKARDYLESKKADLQAQSIKTMNNN